MKTECPHCHTVFRVSEQQLQHGAGQVRCGHCLAIFTAEIPKQMSFDDLLDAQESAASIDAEPGVQNDAGAISHKLDAALRRQSAVQEKQISESDDMPDGENDLSLAMDVSENDQADFTAESVASVAEEKFHPVLPDVIPPSLRAETRAGKKRYGLVSGIFWSLAIWLLILIGLAQYAWYDRLHLMQYPQARPWLERACGYLRCELPELRDPSRIELSRKNIYTHPNNKQGLMVSGTMVNQAEFAQDFPLLELRFENVRGEMIAARRFTPDEYLDLSKDSLAKMQPGEPVAFTLEIIDPGPEVVSYEFTFL